MGDNIDKTTFVFFITTLVLATNRGVEPKSIDPLSEEYINQINEAQNSWTAGQNFHPETPYKDVKKLLGVVKRDHEKYPGNHQVELTKRLPKSFDARKKWPNCKSINEIRDQGNCNNDWAVAAAAVMTDRVCIHSEGKQQFHFSTIDLTSCCEKCGMTCLGGNPYQAWDYYLHVGIVSGGNYNSTTGCRPYPYKQCNHDQTADNGYPKCEDVQEKPLICEKKCTSKDLSYEKDKRKAKKIYFLDFGEEQMKKEIYTLGPVEASFDVYEDFLSYKTGVYVQTKGAILGSHAVKIIGWGIENNTKYWLAANSWNEKWGDKGFFKILRSQNHCNIEEDVYAGIPLLESS